MFARAATPPPAEADAADGAAIDAAPDVAAADADGAEPLVLRRVRGPSPPPRPGLYVTAVDGSEGIERRTTPVGDGLPPRKASLPATPDGSPDGVAAPPPEVGSERSKIKGADRQSGEGACALADDLQTLRSRPHPLGPSTAGGAAASAVKGVGAASQTTSRRGSASAAAVAAARSQEPPQQSLAEEDGMAVMTAGRRWSSGAPGAGASAAAAAAAAKPPAAARRSVRGWTPITINPAAPLPPTRRPPPLWRPPRRRPRRKRRLRRRCRWRRSALESSSRCRRRRRNASTNCVVPTNARIASPPPPLTPPPPPTPTPSPSGWRLVDGMWWVGRRLDGPDCGGADCRVHRGVAFRDRRR